MKTLYFPAEELEAQRQDVTRPQPLSSQESSEEEITVQDSKPRGLETRVLANDLLCDFKQHTCPLWALLFLSIMKMHVGGKMGGSLLVLPAMTLQEAFSGQKDAQRSG